MRILGIIGDRGEALLRIARIDSRERGCVFALSLKRSGDCLPAKPTRGGRRLQPGTEFVALTLCCAPRVIAASLRRLAGAETALFD